MTEAVPGVETVPSPGATITVRRVSAMRGLVVEVAGEVGRSDAGVLRRCLLAELGVPPAVIVLDLTGVTRCDVAVLDVLDAAHQRAEAQRVGLYQIDGPQPSSARHDAEP